MPPRYSDFFLTVDHGRDSYEVSAVGPGEIRVSTTFRLDLSPRLLAISKRIEAGRPPDRKSMERIGSALYCALFAGRIAEAWSLAKGRLGEGENLRLKLYVRPPELRGLPWELLYNPA